MSYFAEMLVEYGLVGMLDTLALMKGEELSILLEEREDISGLSEKNELDKYTVFGTRTYAYII